MTIQVMTWTNNQSTIGISKAKEEKLEIIIFDN